MEKCIKAAIVGAGIFGSFHARTYSEIPYVDTVAICDLNKERAQKIADEYNIPHVYSDYRELLRESNCDFVSIVTPDHLHGRMVVDAAEAGKHIIVEKPFATTREDALAMRQAIKANKVRAMCDLHNRSSQTFAIAKQEIATGKYGKVYNMYIRLNDNMSVPTDMLSWSANSSVIWFLGSHSLDVLSYLCGSRPKTVYCLSRKGLLSKIGIDTDDVFQTSIEFENGVIAQMENTWIVPNGNTALIDLKCNVQCENGAFNINGSDSDMIRIISPERMMTPNPMARPIINGKVEGFAPNNIRSFVDAIIFDKPFNITVDEAVDNTIALLAILESARKKAPVTVKYDD